MHNHTETTQSSFPQNTPYQHWLTADVERLLPIWEEGKLRPSLGKRLVGQPPPFSYDCVDITWSNKQRSTLEQITRVRNETRNVQLLAFVPRRRASIQNAVCISVIFRPVRNHTFLIFNSDSVERVSYNLTRSQDDTLLLKCDCGQS